LRRRRRHRAPRPPVVNAPMARRRAAACAPDRSLNGEPRFTVVSALAGTVEGRAAVDGVCTTTKGIAMVRKAPLAAKVPEITLLFWVIKVLTTGMGEAMSDFLGQKSVPIAGAIGVLGLWYALWLQLRQTEY